MESFDCITVSTSNGVQIVRFVDDKIVNPQRVEKLGNELSALADQAEPAQVLINLGNVRFLSSAAINKLIVLEKRLKTAGGRLKLCEVRPEVQEVFNITHLSSVFDIRTKQDEGLRAFKPFQERG